MSELGHSRRFRGIGCESALPLKAAIADDRRHVREVPISEVGAREARGRYRKAKASGGLEVDDKLVLCWSLYWQIARLFTPEDAIGMTSRALGGMRDQTMLLP